MGGAELFCRNFLVLGWMRAADASGQWFLDSGMCALGRTEERCGEVDLRSSALVISHLSSAMYCGFGVTAPLDNFDIRAAVGGSERPRT